MIAQTIEELLYYAIINLDLKKKDLFEKRKKIFNILQIKKPFDGKINKKTIAQLPVPDIFVNVLTEYSLNVLKLNEEEANRLVTGIMGLLTPSNEIVNEIFNAYHDITPNLALDYLYNLSVKNDYIKKTFVERNITTNALIDGKEIITSINLAKPEKNNKDIARSLIKSVKPVGFPSCVLCHENVGFAGGGDYPPRQNLRDIELNLDGDIWHLQYSPYVYFPYHLIVIDAVHQPMCVCEKNVRHLLTFLDYYPDCFITSNSDLPIIGGSILNHEHFQGGKFDSPLFKCRSKEIILEESITHPEVSIIDWFSSVLLVKGKSKDLVLSQTMKIIDFWSVYSDETVDIIANDGIKHNSVTLMANKNDSSYCMYICLRNNRCDEKYPQGIFHAHPEHHIIKKEGIGISEVMGIFILPARLNRQARLAEEVVKGRLSFAQCVTQYPDMHDFAPMIEKMQKDGLSGSEYMSRTCAEILKNCAVFKNDNQGEKAFKKFIRGFQKL